MTCFVCGRELAYTPRLSAGPDTLLFCSEQCLRAHVKDMREIPEWRAAADDLRAAGDPGFPFQVYSGRLRKYFRSHFEKEFAEFVVQHWREPVFYEHQAISIDAERQLIPDFWFPRRSVWIELKGSWYGNARSKMKFLEAQDIVGPQRLILLPYECRRWFSRKDGAKGGKNSGRHSQQH
jgi:hypothetical protein